MIDRLRNSFAQITLGPAVVAIASFFSMHQIVPLRATFPEDFFMAVRLSLCQARSVLLIAIREDGSTSLAIFRKHRAFFIPRVGKYRNRRGPAVGMYMESITTGRGEA
jgi:hypothetical protein